MTDVLTTTRGIIHGPIKTKRLGAVLKIDISAPQENLVVERGSNLPRASIIVTTSARRMIELSKAGDKVESVIILGSRIDPTAHPDLRTASLPKFASRPPRCRSWDLEATLSLPAQSLPTLKLNRRHNPAL